jgi:hypothetical protein
LKLHVLKLNGESVFFAIFLVGQLVFGYVLSDRFDILSVVGFRQA